MEKRSGEGWRKKGVLMKYHGRDPLAVAKKKLHSHLLVLVNIRFFCKSWGHIAAAEHAFQNFAREVLFSKLDP